MKSLESEYINNFSKSVLKRVTQWKKMGKKKCSIPLIIGKMKQYYNEIQEYNKQDVKIKRLVIQVLVRM